MQDFSTLSMAEIIRLQNELQQELTRRFERQAALAFSDIVGSTEYFSRFGDAAGRQLQLLHVDLVGECLARHQGRLVDAAGDGAFLTFPTADGAIGALMKLQTSVSRANAARSREHQLRLRMGAHWGPVLTGAARRRGAERRRPADRALRSGLARPRALPDARLRIEETADVCRLPDQDIIGFGRLREHEGAAANDGVLTLDDPQRPADQPLAF